MPSTITKGDSYNIINTYTTNNLSGSTVNCSSNLDTNKNITNTNQLTTTGKHNITCTITTGAGKSTSITKNIIITYQAYAITNLIKNGSFKDNNQSGWDCSGLNFAIKNKTAVLTFLPSDNWVGVFGTTYPIAGKSNVNDIFYMKISANIPSNSYGFGLGIQKIGSYPFFAPLIQYNDNKYTTTSVTIIPGSIISDFENIYFGIYHRVKTDSLETVYIDNIVIVNLTSTFGNGNEPDKEWCNDHINYFDNTVTIYK